MTDRRQEPVGARQRLQQLLANDWMLPDLVEFRGAQAIGFRENGDRYPHRADIVQERRLVEQRQVIVLRFLEGRSLAETAAIAGRNEDAVKKLQARGLASLRRRIECLSGCWRVDLEQAS